MKRCLYSFIIIAVLLMNFLSLRITAEDKQEYYNVQIPIFYGNTIDFSTEMLNGITTSQEHKEAKIFISIDDFQRLSNTELIMSDNNSIELRRNTVFIKLKLNDENSDLYLGFDENKYIKSFKVKVPTIYYKNKEYISLLHGLNVFSIDMNIIDKEDILNMISVNKKVDNNDYLISSIEYLDEKIFDFAKYPKFLQISQSSPFDKLYLEYNKNTSDYLFSWQSLRMLNDVTSSLGAVPSNFMSNYDGIFDFVVGGYDSDKRYYDILCTIINNDKSCEETIDFSIAYETITFLSDTGLLNTLVNGNDVLTFIISSVSDCMKATERTVNLIRCSEYQDNVLDKTILNSYNLKKEMMDDKIITDIVNFSIFNKYINNTYLASLYNNQYALYESANKLNKDIDNPIKNVSTEWYRDMIYKTITSIADEGLNVVSGGATEIPDILMKNIKYNNAINNLILEPSEALNNVKDCYFIQETVKNVCNVDIFNETENSYYNFKLMLQSSLTAYEILKENDTLMKIVGEDGQNLILEKINNINSILNNIENCDITFYSTSDISNDMVNIKDISIIIVPIEDETNSTEMVEIEEIENYEWYLEPKIEADNIIVPDYDNELYEKYAIIEKNGKYGLISNKGEFIEDIKYNNILICNTTFIYALTKENHTASVFANDNKDSVLYIWQDNKIQKSHHGDHGLIPDYLYYYNINDNKTYMVSPIEDNCEEYKSDNVVLARCVSMSIKKDGTYTCSNKYDKFYLSNNNGKINNIAYDDGINSYSSFTQSHKIIYAKKDNKYFYFNNKGEQIISDDIKQSYMSPAGITNSSDIKKGQSPFLDVDNVIAVNTKDGGCFYDINGDKLTDIEDFEEVRPMINGFAWVKKDGKWGVIKYNKLKKEDDNWKKEYINCIKRIVGNDINIRDESEYMFVNINGDDIPEIFFYSGFGYGGSALITYNNKNAIDLHQGNSSGIHYIEGENLFDYSGGHMDTYYNIIYQIVDGEFVMLHNGKYGAINNSRIKYDKNGKPIYNYYWNNIQVSEEEYNNLLNEAFDKEKAVYPKDVTKSYSYKEIFKAIENYDINKSENNEQNKGTVSIEDGYLNVRESPSAKGKIIGKLYNSDEIIIEEMSEDNKWLKVFKGDIKGYVSKEYIKIKE